MAVNKNDDTHAAVCLGVKVPKSPFLHETRIERINTAKYEGQEIAGAMHVVGKKDRVLEIGSGLGIVGGVIAHNSKPERIQSYEANPALIPHIEALYKMNKLSKKISVQNQVLVSSPERPKTMEFFIGRSFLGSSLSDAIGGNRGTVDVETASFSEVCDDLKPTVLIMDIEGGELEILQHADLSGFRAVVVEFHPGVYGIPGMRECKKILLDAGFVRFFFLATGTVGICERGAW